MMGKKPASPHHAAVVVDESQLVLEPVPSEDASGQAQSNSRLKAIAPIRVLIVDDERTDRRIIRRLLRMSNQSFVVDEAADFDEALALTLHTDFDCILLDFCLPGGTGLEFSDCVRQMKAGMAPAIIMISGDDSQRLGIESLRHGAANMVCKSNLGDLDLSALILDAVAARQRSRQAFSERMRAFAHLIGKTAHKINNPAAIARLSLSAAVEELRHPVEHGDDRRLNSERILKMLAATDDAISRIAAVVRELENTTGTSLGHVHRFRAEDIARAALRAYEEGTVQLCSAGRSEGLVVGDLSQLARMLEDLIDNAVEATGASGEVRVSYWDDEFYVNLAIDDAGTGIAVEDVEKIFEPLHTTRANEGALGMGLSRVATIVRRHGGTIGVEKSELGGCKVQVRLPTAAASYRPPAMKNSEAPPATRPRLLVIDDEPLLRQQYFRVLGGIFDVQTADSAEAARKLIERFRFDVILCDVTLSTESGVDFVRNLKKQHATQALRVMFITGGVVDEDAAHFVQKWENGCLLKPIAPKDLKLRLLHFVQEHGRA